jgi:hypothetical protein
MNLYVSPLLRIFRKIFSMCAAVVGLTRRPFER